MITTLALVMFTCNVDPTTQQDRCNYKIEQTYSGESSIRTDIIDCLTVLKGDPDIITETVNSYSYRACMLTGEIVDKPGIAFLSSVEDPNDSFIIEVKELDALENAKS